MEKIIDIDERWINEIINGTKRVEGKKNSPKTKQLKLEVGDFIKFSSPNRIVMAKIIDIRHYEQLETYLETETLKRTLPGVNTIKDGITIYMSEPINWTQQEIDKYGVLAIEFELI
jgi:ASC-1-like (ASCH) protein